MRFSILALSFAYAHAFAPVATGRMSAVKPLNKMADDVGIPCEDECALASFPNLPESVHPGVLSGKAMMDLLNHAKENGTFFRDAARRLSP
jgi:fructose-bisphosphate aldolase class II